MYKRLRGSLILLLCLAVLLPVFGILPVDAAQTDGEDTRPAEDISGTYLVTDSAGFDKAYSLFDDHTEGGYDSGKNESFLTLEYAEGIGSLYITFGKEYGEYTVSDSASGQTYTLGQHGFLHEYIDLVALFGTAPAKITLSFSNGRVNICEMDVYTRGEVPATVQKWTAPQDGNIDLMLFSTHDDDAQLFFAGVLPYYAGELGYEVLVVYMTNHPGENYRVHELLNGLWAVGVTNYPVMETFPDFRLMHDMEGTYAVYEELGYPREVLLEYVVEQLRRFKPLVAIGHDINGEYGHGMHLVYTDLLMEAVSRTNDPEFYPELAEIYGVWDVPKTYLHLYEENQIVMDWDTPLSRFDGLTAFEVTKDVGFACHESQYRVFAPYHVPYKYATEVPTYNPCFYGLYRSAVGADVEKNDFFENVLTRAQQILKEDEEAKAEEEARQATEEEARRREEERLAVEETARRQEEMRLQAEQAAQMEQAGARSRNLSIAAGAGIVILALILVLFFRNTKRGKCE